MRNEADRRSRPRPGEPRRRIRLQRASLLLTIALVIGITSSPGRHRRALARRHPKAHPSQLRHHAPGSSGAIVPARPAQHSSHVAVAGTLASLPRMLGQMIVTRFAGTAPSTSLLERIRAGQVGGVILFGDNVAAGLGATRTLIERLQGAAREGGNPPLLIMTDQEGGEVKRLPGPPTLMPSEMTSPSVAFEQGQATGRSLRSLGVNVDLAPVADVERVSDSFLGTRSFGSSPSDVAAAACAFAQGVASAHVAYTLKHFPGLGRATQSTDVAPVWINARSSALRSDYAAYRACGGNPLAMVMVSSAIYPGLTGPLPAVMSPLTYRRELPRATGRSSVLTISDDMQAPAIRDQHSPARQAINAGVDLLLYAGTEQASADAYTTLLNEARSGLVSTSRIRAAYAAIVALKNRAERPTAS